MNLNDILQINKSSLRYVQRTVLVYKNGEVNQSETKAEPIQLNQNIEMRRFQELIRFRFLLRDRTLRIFNTDGVELFQEDLEYVKNGQILYFSKGEDFDARSSFNEYENIGQIGEGGFSKVMLGQHRITKQKVAIKVVNTSLIGNAELIDMVFQEAEMLKSLKHKNIVKIHNCYTLPNMEVVFVMEYLEGGELLAYVQKAGILTEHEACHFFLQIVEGISYCHFQKLIHRDLKLENILLTNNTNKHIKIIDFGIAGLASQFNISKIDMGTLRYMPPEVLLGQTREISYPIDVWALGVILYVMVSGSLPFKGETVEEVVQQITDLDYKIPRKSSQEIKNLIQRMLITDPHKRIKISQILQHQWIMDNTQSATQELRLMMQKEQMIQIANSELLKPPLKQVKKVKIPKESDDMTITIPIPTQESKLSNTNENKNQKLRKVKLKPRIKLNSEGNEKLNIDYSKLPQQYKQRGRSHHQKTEKTNHQSRNQSSKLPNINVSYNIMEIHKQLCDKQFMLKCLFPTLGTMNKKLTS